MMENIARRPNNERGASLEVLICRTLGTNHEIFELSRASLQSTEFFALGSASGHAGIPGSGLGSRDFRSWSSPWLVKLARPAAKRLLVGEEPARQIECQGGAMGRRFSRSVHAGDRQRQALHHGISRRWTRFTGRGRLF